MRFVPGFPFRRKRHLLSRTEGSSDRHRSRRSLGRRPRSAQSGQAAFLERFEPRIFLTAATFVTELEDLFLPTGSYKGTALTVGIDADDADGDSLTISAFSDDPNLLAVVPQDNRFARLDFVEADGVSPIGEILIELFEDRFPENTEQFVALATTGFDENGNVDPEADPFWTDVLVHRIVPDFVIQTGDAENGNGTGSSPLGNFDGKTDPQVLSYANAGVVGWANSTGLSTNDSQFFITAKETSFLNPGYAILGHVISGYEVFDDLINRAVKPGTQEPEEAIIMKSVAIVESPQDGALTVVVLSPANVTTLYDADTGQPPDAPTWVFQETAGPGGETTVRTADGATYVFDTMGHEEIRAAHGVNTSSQLITLNTDGGYRLDFTLRIDQETHSTFHRAGFSFITVGSDPTQSLEVAFWNDRVWVYDFDRDAVEGEEDFLHGAEALLDTTISRDYSLRVENDTFTLLVDDDEVLSGPLVDYTGSRPLPAPYDVPNSLVFGDGTSRAAGKAEVTGIVFTDSLVELEGEFDGRAQVTISLDDGTGNVTEKTINALDVGDRPFVTDPGSVFMSPGESVTVPITITDDLDAPLDIDITTEQEGVELSIEQDEAIPNQYTITITVPEEFLAFEVTISVVESGMEGVDSIEPTTRVFTVSTVGDPPIVVDAPDQIDMVPGQSNIFNIEITDDQDVELDVSIDSEQEGVTLAIEKISFPNLYQVTVNLPNEHVHFDMNINASEAGVLSGEAEPRTTVAVVVSTIGDRPTIEDPGEQRADPGAAITFTADIADDTNAPLDIEIETDQAGVTAEINPDTFEVTITLPVGEQVFFDTTISVVETAGADVFDPTTSTFKVSTLGELPVIEDTGPVLISRGVPTTFTPVINDDGGLDLDVSASVSTQQITVEIDEETGEITITPTNANHFSFELTVSAQESGFDGRTTATRNFAVFTGVGVVDTDAGDGGETIGNFIVGDRMYVANGTDGLKIFDISDPTAAVLLGEFDTTNARDVVVVDTTAFMIVETDGLLALDVSDPGNITQLDAVPMISMGKRIRVHPDRPDIAYVAGATRGLVVYDISDSTAIEELGAFYELSDDEYLNDAVWLDFNDDFLFVSDRTGGIKVFEIDDPAVPVYKTSFFVLNKPAGIAVDDDLLYVTDPDKNRILIFDVGQPTSVERLAIIPIEDSPARVTIFEDIAIVGRSEGYAFFNVLVPDQAFFVDAINCDGRGTYPFIQDELISLPVRDAAKVVFIDADDLRKQMVVTKRHTFLDNNDVEITIKISGPGIAVPTTTGVGFGDIERLEIFGSTRRTSVTITTKGGETTLGGVGVSGALKKFVAPTVDLDGFFNSIRIVRKLTLDDTLPGSTINIGPSIYYRDTTRVNLDEAEGLTFNFSSPISSFNATNVADTAEFSSSISGSSIGRMRIDLDFQADVTLSGFFLDRYTMGSTRIRRDLTNSVFNLTGDMRKFRVDGVVNDVSIDVKGEARSIRFDDVINATVSVNDVLRSVRATRWQAGAVLADEIKSLKVTGSKEIEGDFGADINARILKRASIKGNLEGSTINLSQAVDPARSSTKALRRLKIKGWMMDSELLSLGHLGKLTLGGMRNSRIASGVRADIETSLPQVAEDFEAEARISSLRVIGIEDEPFSMINSHIAAWVQKSVRLVGVKNTNDGVEFGLAAHEIGRLRQSDLADGAEPIGGGGPGNDSVVRLV